MSRLGITPVVRVEVTRVGKLGVARVGRLGVKRVGRLGVTRVVSSLTCDHKPNMNDEGSMRVVNSFVYV